MTPSLRLNPAYLGVRGFLMKPTLADIPFLQGRSADVLAALEDEAEWFSVPAGWSVLTAGEPPEGVCFLISGSLAAFKPSDRGGHQLLGYIRPGEPVGEMALIAREPHTSSVFAMRDSELLKLRPESFEKLVEHHRKLMEHMARLMLSRARMSGRRNPRAEPKVFALIATSPTIDLQLRARVLRDAMKRLGKSVCIVGEEARTWSRPGSTRSNTTTTRCF